MREKQKLAKRAMKIDVREKYHVTNEEWVAMKIYDKVKKVDVEINDYKELIQIMRDGRQVDLYLKEKTSDDMGYMTWDVEHWSSVDNRRFIRCYSLEGRVLGESTGHNIYDLENDFKPEEAAKIELS